MDGLKNSRGEDVGIKARDQQYYFDYNTLDQVLIMCAIFLCVIGLMFQSNQFYTIDIDPNRYVYPYIRFFCFFFILMIFLTFFDYFIVHVSLLFSILSFWLLIFENSNTTGFEILNVDNAAFYTCVLIFAGFVLFGSLLYYALVFFTEIWGMTPKWVKKCCASKKGRRKLYSNKSVFNV